MLSAPVFKILKIEFFERDVTFRMPFKFGVTTLTRAPQVFVRAKIKLSEGREGWGIAAELLVPKWFDKNVNLSNEENFDQLRASLLLASELYTSENYSNTAFGHFAQHYSTQIRDSKQKELNSLIACFGPALIDRALLDALCRLHNQSFYQAMHINLAGMTSLEITPEIANFNINGFLRNRSPQSSVFARHTVGLADPITKSDLQNNSQINDGLPETLEEVIAEYGNVYFKIKVGGNIAVDLDRLSSIAAVLDRSTSAYYVTLDGNEQYETADQIIELWSQLLGNKKLERFISSILFIEQPINRKNALEQNISKLAVFKDVIIDESDSDLNIFPQACKLGYSGVSSKDCKGFYKSIINAMRCVIWNEEYGKLRFFMSAEDLTTQAGIAVQQDLSLISFLGHIHVERNGHHYVDGMRGLPDAEQQSFFNAHPDLYHRVNGVTRLKIRNGMIAIGSLACQGFGVAAEPNWANMAVMKKPSLFK